jgi:hypothetical protein
MQPCKNITKSFRKHPTIFTDTLLEILPFKLSATRAQPRDRVGMDVEGTLRTQGLVRNALRDFLPS